MKYSTGPANRALMGGCRFQAGERGKAVAAGLRVWAVHVLGQRERAWGSGGREEGG